MPLANGKVTLLITLSSTPIKLKIPFSISNLIVDDIVPFEIVIILSSGDTLTTGIPLGMNSVSESNP